MKHFRSWLLVGPLAMVVVMAAPGFGQGRQAQTQTPVPSTPAPSTPATTPGGRGRGGVPGPVPAVGGEVDETPVVTQHSIQVDGKTLNYTATAAQMPIKDSSGDTQGGSFLENRRSPGNRSLKKCARRRALTG